MKRTLVLMLLSTATPALAQYNAGPFAGPYNVPVSGVFQSINLNGELAPSGSYSFVQIKADWNRAASSGQWQNDMRAALTNQAVNSGTLIGAGVTRYYSGFSTAGAAPTTALANSTPGTIFWEANCDSAFTANGSNPLFLAFNTSYLNGSDVNLSNITVTLSSSAPVIPNATCGTSLDISGSAAASLTGAGTNLILPSVYAAGASSAVVSSPTFSCGATVTRTLWYTFTPPATAPYTFSTCTSNGTINSVANNIIGVYEAGPSGSPCDPLTQTGCSTFTCTGGAQLIGQVLDSSKTYYVVVGRTGTSSLGSSEKRYQLRIDRLAPLPPCTAGEAEGNDSKSTANAVTMAPSDALCGTTTGTDLLTPGATSYDYFKVKVAQASGIQRNRLTVSSFVGGHSLSILGLGQTNGVIGTSESVLQNTSFLPSGYTGPKFVQFYTLGNAASANANSVYIRVGGVPQTTTQYAVQLTQQDVTPVALSRTLRPGSLTITSVGQTGSSQTDTDLWLYDSSMNPIAGAGNDDSPDPDGAGTLTSSAGSTLTRTLSAGTYYLATARYNLANNQASPTDDNYRAAPVADFPGVLLRGVTSPTTGTNNLGFKITDSEGIVTVAATSDDIYEVLFYRLDVQPATFGCSPADIAYGDGEPLPPIGQPGGFNPEGPDGGDFDCFFNFYFAAAPDNAVCDIAYGDGEPLPPYGVPGGFNPGVDGGDFDCFFNYYFNGCL